MIVDLVLKIEEVTKVDKVENAGTFKSGDVICVAPHGHEWSPSEQAVNVIVTADLFPSTIDALTYSTTIIIDGKEGLKRRKYGLNLSAVKTEKVRKAILSESDIQSMAYLK